MTKKAQFGKNHMAEDTINFIISQNKGIKEKDTTSPNPVGTHVHITEDLQWVSTCTSFYHFLIAPHAGDQAFKTQAFGDT